MTITKDSVFEQVNKFLQFWSNGQKASFKIECENGEAVMNMSVCLKSSRKTRNSPSKIKRNKVRAEIYRKKKQLEIGEDPEQLHEQFDFNDEDVVYINSDLNGNGADSNGAIILSSNADFILSSDNDYQVCFVEDEESLCEECDQSCDDDCDLNSNESEQEHDTELSISDQDEIDNEDDAARACRQRRIELETEQWEFDDDVFSRNPDLNGNDKESDENIIPDKDCELLEPEMIPMVFGEEVEKDPDKLLNSFKTNLMNLKADIWKSDVSEYNKLTLFLSVVEKLSENFKGFSSLREQNGTKET